VAKLTSYKTHSLNIIYRYKPSMVAYLNLKEHIFSPTPPTFSSFKLKPAAKDLTFNILAKYILLAHTGTPPLKTKPSLVVIASDKINPSPFFVLKWTISPMIPLLISNNIHYPYKTPKEMSCYYLINTSYYYTTFHTITHLSSYYSFCYSFLILLLFLLLIPHFITHSSSYYSLYHSRKRYLPFFSSLLQPLYPSTIVLHSTIVPFNHPDTLPLYYSLSSILFVHRENILLYSLHEVPELYFKYFQTPSLNLPSPLTKSNLSITLSLYYYYCIERTYYLTLIIGTNRTIFLFRHLLSTFLLHLPNQIYLLFLLYWENIFPYPHHWN